MKVARSKYHLAPLWKVKRELLRIANRGDEVLHRATGLSVLRQYVKLVTDRRVDFQKGNLELGRRVAIYLIFPDNGILESHRIALNYIIRCGYTPVIVSNLTLSRADQAELKALSAHLILRPNFGYDFGGYRDAMRLLAPSLSKMDYLAIFNDSAWFPVKPELDWLHEAEAMQRDFVGSVFHDGMNSKSVLDFSTTAWEIDPAAELFHYGSYSILIGRGILSSGGFRRFWDDYIPSSFKQLTILRGEIGLSQWVIANGHSHGALCDNENLDRLMDDLPIHRLTEIAANLIDYGNPELAMLRAQTWGLNPPDRASLRNLILSVVARQGPAYALIDFDIGERRGNFVKKAPLRWNRAAAEATLRVLRRCESAESAVFLREALTAYERTYGEPWTAR